jgi:hypothetical protein
MSRPIDKTKASNHKCKNCEHWQWFKRCYNPASPNHMKVVGYSQRCDGFKWSDEGKGMRNDAE